MRKREAFFESRMIWCRIYQRLYLYDLLKGCIRRRAPFDVFKSSKLHMHPDVTVPLHRVYPLGGCVFKQDPNIMVW